MLIKNFIYRRTENMINSGLRIKTGDKFALPTTRVRFNGVLSDYNVTILLLMVVIINL